MHVLERTQTIPAAPDAVFAFFSDPGNLARITPPWLRFRLVGEVPTPIAAGARFEYRIRWLVFRLRWVTRITVWDPPHGFEDVEERGPYRLWRHRHSFEPGPGGVVMRDRVEYALPFGALGRLAHFLVVRRQLDAIFAFRRRAIAEIFPGEPAKKAARA